VLEGRPPEPQAGEGTKEATASGTSGRVVDPNGVPIAGADVLAFGDKPASENSLAALLFDELPREGREVARTRTDAAGVFRLDASGSAPRWLVARARGHWSDGAREAPDVRIALGPEVVVEGAVVDEEGRAIEGARVLAAALNGVGGGAIAATTDAKGRFRVEGLAMGFDAILVAFAEGRVPGSATVHGHETEDADASPEIRLERSRPFAVVVREEGTDAPIEGATLLLWTERSASAARTDASGSAGLLVGAVLEGELLVTHPSFRFRRVKDLSEGLVVRLRRHADLRGRVLALDGTPVRGARVSWAGDPGVEVLTDGEGFFRIEDGSPAERRWVEAWAEGFLRARSEVFAAAPGQVVRVPDITLRRGVRLVVRALRGRDQPLDDARVDVTATWDDELRTWTQFTKEDGRADYGPTPPGYAKVLVRHVRFKDAERTVLLSGEGVTHEEEIPLAPRTDD
jgi:protocatechuate 3,4-dioxygenase beta subunit